MFATAHFYSKDKRSIIEVSVLLATIELARTFQSMPIGVFKLF